MFSPNARLTPLALTVIAATLISGCTQTPGSPPGASASIPNLTGRWQGGATWRANVENPPCAYEGLASLALTQSGSDLSGTLAMAIKEFTPLTRNGSVVPCSGPGPLPPASLRGTVNSSGFTFTSGTPPAVFYGTITNNQLSGAFESCPNQGCLDGSRAVGPIGEFSFTKSK